MTRSTRGPSHYDLLGVADDATLSQIKSAYRRHAHATHPDQNPAASAHLFGLIRSAYEVLSDPARRAEYDRQLGQPDPPQAPSQQAPRPSPPRPAAQSPRPDPAPPRATPRPQPAPVRQPAAPHDHSSSTTDTTGRQRVVPATVGGAGLLIMIGLLAVPLSRHELGSTLGYQLLGLAIAVPFALRGAPVAMYIVTALHAAFIALLAATGALQTLDANAWILVLETIAVGACTYAAVLLRGRRRRPTSSLPQPIRFGRSAVAWNKLGCGGWVLTLVGAPFVATPAAAMIAETIIWARALPEPTAWSIRGITFVVLYGLTCWGVAVGYRRITRHTVYWCEHCGVRTDPVFRICRSCGRVKALA